MGQTYGIDTAIWVRLPPDDQAAVKAGYLGQPIPKIGGYADPVIVPAATSAPPPTLSSLGAQSFAQTLADERPAVKPIVTVVKPIEKATVLPKPESTAQTLAAHEATLGTLQAAIGKSGSTARPAGAYYTYRDEVPLKPGQTLAFTPGKGYYASGTPTPVKATTTPPTPSGSNLAGGGEVTHYTYKDDVPLKPGQTLGFTPGKGYYAAGTSTPVKATTTPATPPGSKVADDGAVTHYTYEDDVPLKPGQTLGFTGGKGYYALSAAASSARTPVTAASPARALFGQSPLELSRPLARLVAEAKQPPKLTAAQANLAKKLEHTSVGGQTIVNPVLTVKAAAIAGLPLALACALLSQESFGGRNIWGFDQGGHAIFTGGLNSRTEKQWGHEYAYTHTITEAGYRAYREEQRTILKMQGILKQQGVGPTQLTSASLQNYADEAGGSWKPLPNMIIGFSNLAYYVNTYKLALGLERYNGSPAYANPVLTRAREWANALGLKSVEAK